MSKQQKLRRSEASKDAIRSARIRESMILSYKSIPPTIGSAMATVEITPEALEQAEALNEPIYSRVMELVERLKNWPAVSGAKPLRHRLAGRYRMRTGDYRVQFRVRGDTVVVERIGRRDGFYGD